MIFKDVPEKQEPLKNDLSQFRMKKDMRLAPLRRKGEIEDLDLAKLLENPMNESKLYLKAIKSKDYVKGEDDQIFSIYLFSYSGFQSGHSV